MQLRTVLGSLDKGHSMLIPLFNKLTFRIIYCCFLVNKLLSRKWRAIPKFTVERWIWVVYTPILIKFSYIPKWYFIYNINNSFNDRTIALFNRYFSFTFRSSNQYTLVIHIEWFPFYQSIPKVRIVHILIFQYDTVAFEFVPRLDRKFFSIFTCYYPRCVDNCSFYLSFYSDNTWSDRSYSHCLSALVIILFFDIKFAIIPMRVYSGND